MMGWLFLRLEVLVSRRRRLVIASWCAVVLLALPFAFRQSENLEGGAPEVPDSGSAAVDRLLEQRFQTDGQPVSVVLRAGPSTPSAARRASIDHLRAALQASPALSASEQRLERAELQLVHEGAGVIRLRAPTEQQAALEAARELNATLMDAPNSEQVESVVIGQPALFAAVEDEAQDQLREAEVIGLPIVALLLLAAFGSLAAASLPLALGAVAVIVTGAEIYLLSRSLEMSVYVTNIASMLGIGVAVDYSLFILARFREEVAAGASLDEARGRAVATSGVAVFFSGLVVIWSLGTLWLIDSTLLRSLALGAILVVVAAVLLAATLLPALISALGQRAVRRRRVIGRLFTLARRPRRGPERQPASPAAAAGPSFWRRWTATVTGRPVLFASAATAVLLVLAIPTLSLETTAGPLRQLDQRHEARESTELAASIAGGFPGTIRIAVEPSNGQRPERRHVDALAAALRRDQELTRVTVRSSGQTFLIEASSRHDAESPEARDAIDRVEADILPRAPLAGEATLHVGGEAPRIRDVGKLILGSMWRVVGAALLLSFVVLVVVLGSVLLPLKAVLMNLLSIGAAYGVLVAVFQWGWFDDLLGFESLGAVTNLSLPLVFAVVLGLSMDYELFLLIRIRDRYRTHGDSRRAIAEGLAASAGTITSAALVMTAVFLVFFFTAVPSVKEIGLGTAVAIALDATLVRLVLVPATMQLFGDWNWWLPRRLARLLHPKRRNVLSRAEAASGGGG